jgi:SAM-dependent methyltransferase
MPMAVLLATLARSGPGRPDGERVAVVGCGMAREQRLIFGEDPALYDRIRPAYPEVLLDDITALVPPDGRVVDVGCGTGKATVGLANRVATGVGVEPDPAMAAICGRHLDPFPGWRVEVTEFESWDPGPDGYQLVTCAQAWHWLTPGERDAQSRATLVRGGWLAVWWNRTDTARNPLRGELDEVYARLAPDMRHRAYGPDEVADPVPLAGFAKVKVRDYRWTRRYAAAEWLDLMRSTSEHRMLGKDREAPLLAAVAEVIDRHGGYFDPPFCTTMWLTQRT